MASRTTIAGGILVSLLFGVIGCGVIAAYNNCYILAKYASGNEHITIASPYGHDNRMIESMSFQGDSCRHVKIIDSLAGAVIFNGESTDPGELRTVSGNAEVRLVRGSQGYIMLSLRRIRRPDVGRPDFKVSYDGIDLPLSSTIDDVVGRLPSLDFIITKHHK
jgi:hypothetical protein